GNKFSSKYAHKGVRVLLLLEKLISHTESGIIPDITVNPHVFSSRMTLRHLIEMFIRK
ncbi:hypothetical protein LY90DRAFT_395970, partial [Neocallimastix californiae]